jgi:hypothetical protein
MSVCVIVQALPGNELLRDLPLELNAVGTLWATACGTALWPAGTFAHAYDANRRAAVEGLIETDPVAVCVRRLMAERTNWAGTASDLLRVATSLVGDDISKKGVDWPKHPGALAGRLRRVQTPLRVLGIEVSFSREGRAGDTDDQDKLGRLQPSHQRQRRQQRQHRQRHSPRHLGVLRTIATRTGAFVMGLSDADDADDADATAAEFPNQLQAHYEPGRCRGLGLNLSNARNTNRTEPLTKGTGMTIGRD